MYRYDPLKEMSYHSTNNCIGDKQAINLYKSMLIIRRVEEKIGDEYHHNEMKTPIHLCIGEEGAATGVCLALGKEDHVYSNHRGHGHYIAKGGNLNAMIAELYCRETGCSKGRGGSMHLIDLAVGLIGSSSIVGGSIPLATGGALSLQMQKKKGISVAFFGDGAAEEGVLFESMNFAKLKNLPLLYVCINNFYAVCSPKSYRNVGTIYKRAAAFDMPSYLLDGTDVEAIYNTTTEAIKTIKKTSGPIFLEIRAYRWRGHGGANEDYTRGYRNQSEFDTWKKRCPIQTYQEQLIQRKILNHELIQLYEKEIATEIHNAFTFAETSPLPNGDDLLSYVNQK